VQKHDDSGNGHRKLWFIGGAAAAGAALGIAAVVWQRSRYQAWVEDDAVHNAIDETPEPERLNTDEPNPNHDGSAPESGDTDADAHASSARHGDKHE
jgi:hypothetical protein